MTFVWTDATGNVVGNTAGIGNLTAGTYSVLITDANGCTATSSATIGFANLSNVAAANDSAVTNPAIPVSVNAVANDVGQVSTITVLLGPYHGTGSFDANGIYTYTSNANFVGIDSVVYRICDPVCVNDCRTAIIYLVVDDRAPVDVPTGFSPNGDGYNDFFVISNLEQYPDNELLIYNRWGGLIYTAAPYNNDWDGTSMAAASIRGDKVVDGTYFVILKLGTDYPSYQGYLEIRTQ
jgi:gliding motility-associated-like protein